MADSYHVTLEDIPTDIKVGVPVTLRGESGLKVDNVSLYIDGFPIGEAGFGRPGPETKSWVLEYTFNGSGKGRLLQLVVKDSVGTIFQTRKQFLDVEPAIKIEPKPETKPSGKFQVKIVESEIRHAVRWNNDLVGIVFHYSAGRPENNPSGLLEMGVKNGYTYWALTPDGTVYKTHSLREFGYHVGMYRHKNHLGVEIASPGKLVEKGGRHYAWYDLNNPWPEDQVRYFEGSKTQIKGYYAKFTKEQEAAMVGLVQYVKDHCPKFTIENVVAHDECMSEMGWYGEKQDVGGSLSMSIEDFRAYLKKVIV